MNELPVGFEWPSPEEQLERTEKALSTIGRRAIALITLILWTYEPGPE